MAENRESESECDILTLIPTLPVSLGAHCQPYAKCAVAAFNDGELTYQAAETSALLQSSKLVGSGLHRVSDDDHLRSLALQVGEDCDM